MKKLLAAIMVGVIFIGGMFVPTAWQHKVKSEFYRLMRIERKVERLAGTNKKPTSTSQSVAGAAPASTSGGTTGPGAASSANAATPPADATQDGKDKKDNPPVALAEVQRPLQLGEGDKLGLGLGMYASVAGGAAVQAQVEDLGYKTRYVAVRDKKSDIVWQVLIAGEYDNPGDAERDQAILADSLQGVIVPDIVRIPPEKKADKGKDTKGS